MLPLCGKDVFVSKVEDQNFVQDQFSTMDNQNTKDNDDDDNAWNDDIYDDGNCH